MCTRIDTSNLWRCRHYQCFGCRPRKFNLTYYRLYKNAYYGRLAKTNYHKRYRFVGGVEELGLFEVSIVGETIVTSKVSIMVLVLASYEGIVAET